MPEGNWRTLALLGCVAALASVLLFFSFVSIVGLPLTGWTGLTPLAGLLLLTLAASRLTVTVTSADGVNQSARRATHLLSERQRSAAIPVRHAGERRARFGVEREFAAFDFLGA